MDAVGLVLPQLLSLPPGRRCWLDGLQGWSHFGTGVFNRTFHDGKAYNAAQASRYMDGLLYSVSGG